ncbi:MAG: CocE/NonD family hydrolase [Thermoanaerobaculia bacterium]
MRPARAENRSPLRVVVALLVLAVTVGLAPAGGQEPPSEDAVEAFVRSHYTKREVRIPMRDGVHLFTAIYAPNDAGAGATYPILLHRTPYAVDPYGAAEYPARLGPSDPYAEEGFIFVEQDVRGRFMSEGEFVNMRPEGPRAEGEPTESTDTYDTIEWLLANVAGHNGKVGLWGVSYPGFYASAGAIQSHPALAAVSPQAPIADWWWDDMHHHGAFILPLAFNFFSTFGQPRPEPTTEWPERFDPGTPDGYDFFLEVGPLSNLNEEFLHGEVEFWNRFIEHPSYDEFWQSRNVLPHLRGVDTAVMTVGGWFDTEDLYGPLATYRAIERQNPGIFNVLVMGPWPHGGWSRTEGRSLGEAEWGFSTSEYYLENVELPFFRHFLKGEGELHLPEALVFETGANRWRRFAAWPPEGLRQETLYLRGGGGLAFEPPAAGGETAGEPGVSSAAEAGRGAAGGPEEPGEAARAGGFDAFVSDPAKPVPYTMEITSRWARKYMTEDQRFAAWRPDVLVYRSGPLEEDLTLAGPLEADLWVSTTGRDADWIVKVIDEYPTDEPGWAEGRPERPEEDLRGTQRLVRAEVMRGRFRESYEAPKPFEPGEATRVRFRLHDVLHTFRRGHRIMVQVQSTWFPFVDRNPQSWVPNIFEAQEEDFVPATHRVYRSPEHSSGVRVGVLEE